MSGMSLKVFTIIALSVAVGLATAISPFASPSPDGLERVAEDKAFLENGKPAAIHDSSPIPDYAFPGVENERVATGLAGFVGSLSLFVIGYGLALLVRRRGDPQGASGASRASP
jgi:hypothetical protein